MVKINEKDYKKIENFCKDYGVEIFQSEKDTFCLSHVSLRDDQILDYWNEYQEEKIDFGNEKWCKKLTVDRISDLLKYKVIFDEESKKEREKIVNDTWNLAVSMQKMRSMAEKARGK